jgi:hypothetical protein
VAESPDLACALRLLDFAKRHGFVFQRLAPGPDAPLWGVRESEQWRDTIYLGGFWAPGSCSATRRRKSSLIVPGALLVTERVSGDALNVLNAVVSRWRP